MPPSCSSRDTRICKFSPAVEYVLDAHSWVITPFCMPAHMRNSFSPRSWSISTCSANMGGAVPGDFWVGRTFGCTMHNLCHRVCTQFFPWVSNVYDFECTEGEKQTRGERVYLGELWKPLERGALLRESHWLLKLPGCAECPRPPQVPRGAEPAISCPSNRFWH